jgi:hypothetical protein
MSHKSRKYKKVEAFFSTVRPAAPDSPSPDGVHPPAPRTPAEGFGGSSREGTPFSPSGDFLRVPLMVSGTTIGAIQGAGSEAGWTGREIEIVNAVAAQLAQHLEHLRSLERNPS